MGVGVWEVVKKGKTRGDRRGGAFGGGLYSREDLQHILDQLLKKEKVRVITREAQAQDPVLSASRDTVRNFALLRTPSVSERTGRLYECAGAGSGAVVMARKKVVLPGQKFALRATRHVRFLPLWPF